MYESSKNKTLTHILFVRDYIFLNRRLTTTNQYLETRVDPNQNQQECFLKAEK